ncbi:MAG: ABC transporter substrate-binding protein [Actinomycetota bacterium]|nr:ABC transporter substrate-binding protein [Actinomycetota bacterium]
MVKRISRSAPAAGLRWAVALVAVAVFVGACAGADDSTPAGNRATRSGFPVTLTDDEGTSVTVRRPPQRIVTFGQSDTEIVFALGAGNRLVGVCCEFDNFPPAATKLPHVAGAAQKPNPEKVISLRPDLMLNAFPGADTWSKALRDAGIPVFTTLAKDFDDAVRDIQTIGRLLGTPHAAAALGQRMRREAAAIEARAEAAGSVSCFLDLGGLYTVAPGDFIYDLLERAGCDPVTSTAKTPFPQWSKEQLVKDDPEIFLFMSDSGTTIASLRKDAALSKLSAVRTNRVFSVNGDLVSRPGPRLAQGLQALARALHPDAFA